MTERCYRAVLEEHATVVGVAKWCGVTRQTVHNWVRRYLDGGLEALADRCSHRPRGCPYQTGAEVEARICELHR